MKHESFYEPAFDGRKVFFNHWSADDAGKATIALVHGMGEHSGRYAHFAEFFTAHGVNVVALDTFGFGKTEGKKGHTHKMNDYLLQIDQLIAKAKNLHPNQPIFLYGHSMGGGLVLNYVCRKSADIQGVIASAPSIKPAFKVPKIKIWIGKIARVIFPSLTQPNGLNVNHLSVDKAVIDAYIADPLVHDTISGEVGITLLEWGDWLIENGKTINIPLLVMHGTEDKITSCEASENWTNAVEGKKTFKAWQGMYHEIHNEPEQRSVFEFTLGWILGRE